MVDLRRLLMAAPLAAGVGLHYFRACDGPLWQVGMSLLPFSIGVARGFRTPAGCRPLGFHLCAGCQHSRTPVPQGFLQALACTTPAPSNCYSAGFSRVFKTSPS
jgi:hypothetical protein